MLNIQIRVQAQQAQQQINAMRGALRGLGQLGQGNVAGGLASVGGAFSAIGDKMVKFGKNVQWTGRQLEYAFTLPIVAAGAVATKFALDNERATTQLRKVYGLLEDDTHNINNELKILGGTFEALSTRFGVHQAEVISIGQTWAEAGLSGLELQKAVRNTLEAMTIGSLDAQKATEGLIGIQFALGSSSDELRDSLAQLDLIQVQSGISFSGLIDVMARSASVAKIAGIDLRHLAAMAAAIVPAAGGAAQAGNALRTIITRLLVPSKDASDLFQMMGIQMSSFFKQAGPERFNTLLQKWSQLSDEQKVIVGTTVASRFQVNRFAALMNDAARTAGYYNKSLDTTSDKTKTFAIYQQQLNTVLNSSPQRLKILGTYLQNSLARVIAPLLPAITGLVAKVVNLATAFSRLSPQVQQMLLVGLAALALLGPLMRYIAAFNQLFGVMFNVIGAVMTGSSRLMRAVIRDSGVVLKAFDNLTKAIGQSLFNFFNGLGGYLNRTFVQPFFAAAQAAWQGFVTVFRTLPLVFATIWQSITLYLGRAWQLLVELWGTVTEALQLAWVATTNFIVEVWAALPALLETIWTGFLTAWVTVTNALPVIWEGVNTFIIAVWVSTSTALPAIWATVMATIGTIMESALVFMEQALAFFVETVPTLMRSIPLVFGAVTQASALIWETFTNTLMLLWINLTTIFGEVMAAIPVLAAAAAEAFSTIWLRAQMFAVEGLPQMVMAFGRAVATMVAEAAAAVTAAIGLPELIIGGVIAAVVLMITILLTHFRKQWSEAWQSVIRGASQLPIALMRIFQAVVRVIAIAMQQVAKLLSHLNPFQRHSPSLVDKVTKGTSIIGQQYQDVHQTVANAHQVHSNFMNATSSARGSLQAEQFAKQKADIVGVAPGAGPAVDALIAQLTKLHPLLDRIQGDIDAQQQVVDEWKDRLDAANETLREAQDQLDILKKRSDAARDALDQAKDVLNTLANTPIQGMKAMNDQIFANTMAQKKLRLEMMKMEDTVGMLDDMRDRMAALQGEIENLRGEQASLRAAGAGSDILGPIGDQIAQLQQAQNHIQDTSNDLNDMQEQLDKLQRVGEELDLTNSLQFDPLKKQIEDVTNAVTEIPFDQLYQQIVAQQGVVANLTTAWQQADAATTAQQAVVDQLMARRDELQKSYDQENDKLQAIKDTYQEVNDQIQAMEKSLNELSTAAVQAQGDMSRIQQEFLDAAGTANTLPGPNIDMSGTEEQMKEFERKAKEDADRAIKEIEKEMGKINLFQPFIDMFKGAWNWIKRNAKTIITGALIGLAVIIGEAVAFIPTLILEVVALGLYLIFGPGVFKAIADSIGGVIGAIWDFIKATFGVVVDVFKGIFETVKPVFEAVWNAVLLIMQTVWGVIKPIWEAMVGFIKDYMIPIFQMIGAIVSIVFHAIGLVITNIWSGVIQPALNAIWGFITNTLAPVFGWLWHTVIEPAFNAIGSIISGIWTGTIQPVLQAIWNFITNVLAPVFDWLWHKVIEPALNAIGGVFSAVWGGITDGLKTAANFFIRVFNTIADAIEKVGSVVGVNVKIKRMPLIGESAGGTAPSGGYQGVHGQARGGRIDHPMLAMIGEGNGPEFVIPTEMQYRARALQLWMQAGHALGVQGYAGGGILDKIGHTITSGVGAVGGAIKNVTQGAAAIAFAPFFKIMDVIINQIPSGFFRDLASGMKNQVYNFVTGKHAYNGAYIKGSPRGVLLRAGERNQDELVLPLRRGMPEGSGTREIHFHGDLSFPNITKPEHAEKFLDNLESLAAAR